MGVVADERRQFGGGTRDGLPDADLRRRPESVIQLAEDLMGAPARPVVRQQLLGRLGVEAGKVQPVVHQLGAGPQRLRRADDAPAGPVQRRAGGGRGDAELAEQGDQRGRGQVLGPSAPVVAEQGDQQVPGLGPALRPGQADLPLSAGALVMPPSPWTALCLPAG